MFYAVNTPLFTIIAASVVKKMKPDLLIEYLYRHTQIPIMIICSDKKADIIVNSIHNGAVHYMYTPVDEELLAAHVNLYLRRYIEPETEETPHQIVVGNLKLWLTRRQVFVEDKQIKLTAKQYDILLYLVENHGRVLSYEKIYENNWDEPYLGLEDDKKVVFHIHKIQQKLQDPSLIENERNFGYCFRGIPE